MEEKSTYSIGYAELNARPAMVKWTQSLMVDGRPGFYERQSRGDLVVWHLYDGDAHIPLIPVAIVVGSVLHRDLEAFYSSEAARK